MKEFLEEYIYWPIWRIWDVITNIPREIRWFIQRGRRGYADCDVLDLCDYLAGWIPNALRALSKNSFGCPSDVFDKTKKENQCWKWEKILEEMAEGFEVYEKIASADYVNIETNTIDYKKRKEWYEKFNKALELFKTYFEGLWD